MEPIVSSFINPLRLTPAGEQCFFGYYDVPAFSADDRRHLFHRVGFRDRLPVRGDVAEILVADVERGSCEVVGETRSWCFQQGSLLHWYGGAANSIIFNDDAGQGDYRTVIQDLSTGARREFARAQASVSRDGRWALGINFDRIFDFRPGYGYCGKRDPFADTAVPQDDGIFLLDLISGAEQFILPFPLIWDQMASAFDGQAKIVVNHINFNPSGSRFVFLARSFPEAGKTGWRTATLVAERDGSGLRSILPVGMASHYWWMDDDHLMIWGEAEEGRHLYRIDVGTGERETIDADYLTWDGHCTTSPDNRWLLYDSYNIGGYRRFYLYNMETGKGMQLAEILELPVECHDNRCDLHGVWNRAGTACSIDATFEGFRGVYLVGLAEVMDAYF